MQDNQWRNWPVAIATKTVAASIPAQSKAEMIASNVPQKNLNTVIIIIMDFVP